MRLEIFVLMTIGFVLAGWITHSNTIMQSANIAPFIATNTTGIGVTCPYNPANPTGQLDCGATGTLSSGTILGMLMLGVAAVCGLAVIVGGISFIPGLSGIGNLFQSIGFASIYILPALMIGGLVSLQLFVFPFGFLTASGVSEFITYPVMMLYNFLLITTVFQIIRG